MINIGVAAHISAASGRGCRYNSQMTAQERCSVRNGIWLCQNCAKLIDSDEARYTTDLLQDWKSRAEEAARLQVQSPLRNRSRREILASGVEGYELIDAVEQFIEQILDIERSLEPLWAISPDAPDRADQIEGHVVGLPWFRFMEAATRVQERLHQARRWFLQLGFSVDETERKLKSMKDAVGLAGIRIWMMASLADPLTPPDRLKNILAGRTAWEPFMRIGMEVLPRILDYLRDLLASRKWLLPRPRIARKKPSRLAGADINEIGLAGVMDAFAAAAMEMSTRRIALVHGPILESCLRLDGLRPVDQQQCCSLIEAFGRCALCLSRATKLLWRLCGPEWATDFHRGICSIVSRVYGCALYGENDAHWDTDMKIIYGVSQWLHREAANEYRNDRARSGRDLWASIAEVMGLNTESRTELGQSASSIPGGQRNCSTRKRGRRGQVLQQ